LENQYGIDSRKNGAVSAPGGYASQAEEDAVNAAVASTEPAGIGDGADDLISAFRGNRDDFLR
jgi:hypothetical protein